MVTFVNVLKYVFSIYLYDLCYLARIYFVNGLMVQSPVRVEEHDFFDHQEDSKMPDNRERRGKITEIRDLATVEPDVESVNGVEERNADHDLVEEDLLHHVDELGPVHRVVRARLNLVLSAQD